MLYLLEGQQAYSFTCSHNLGGQIRTFQALLAHNDEKIQEGSGPSHNEISHLGKHVEDS